MFKKIMIMTIVVGCLGAINAHADLTGAISKGIMVKNDVDIIKHYFDGYEDSKKVVHPPLLKGMQADLNTAIQKDSDIRQRAKAVTQVFVSGSAPLYQIATMAEHIFSTLVALAGDEAEAYYEFVNDKKKVPTAAQIAAKQKQTLDALKDSSPKTKAFQLTLKLQDPIAKFKGMTGQMYTFAQMLDSLIKPAPAPEAPQIPADEATADDLFA